MNGALSYAGWALAALFWLMGAFCFEMACAAQRERAPFWGLYLLWPVLFLIGAIGSVFQKPRKND